MLRTSTTERTGIAADEVSLIADTVIVRPDPGGHVQLIRARPTGPPPARCWAAARQG